MSEKTYVKHIENGEVLELISKGLSRTECFDKHGEYRIFKNEVLTPYEPEEAWEDVPREHLDQPKESGLYVFLPNDRIWIPVPSDRGRTTTRNGKLVVQRRKG